MSRVRKIYNLRKTSNLRPPTPSQPSPHEEESPTPATNAFQAPQERVSNRGPVLNLPIDPPEHY